MGLDSYGATIAQVSVVLYTLDDAELRRSGILVHQAMAYGDARGLTDAD